MSHAVKKCGRVLVVSLFFLSLLLVLSIVISGIWAKTTLEMVCVVDVDKSKVTTSDDIHDDPNRADCGDSEQIVPSVVYGPEKVIFSPKDPYATRIKTREVVSARDARRQIWQVIREKTVVDPLTQIETVKKSISEYYAVGDGINYRDINGDWQATKAQWRETIGGFVMDTAGYRLSLGRTLGSWLYYEVAGDELKLRPVSLKAYGEKDLVTLAMIDTLVEGWIDPEDTSRLVFYNAFGKGIDLVLQVEPGGYHQDVIFHQKPQIPLSMAEETVSISVYTELALDDLCRDEDIKVFMDRDSKETVQDQLLGAVATDSNLNTVPIQRDIEIARLVNDGQEEKIVSRHRFVASKVFDDGDNGFRQKGEAVKQLYRDWDNRTYLIESLDNGFFEKAIYPVVWDYETISSGIDSNETEVWFGGRTYYVTCDVNVAGKLIIEPGAVVKFTTDAVEGKVTLNADSGGKIIAKGEPYMPIIFTSANDYYSGELTQEFADPSPAPIAYKQNIYEDMTGNAISMALESISEEPYPNDDEKDENLSTGEFNFLKRSKWPNDLSTNSENIMSEIPSNGGPLFTPPAKEDWGTIEIGKDSIFEFCRILYAETGLNLEDDAGPSGGVIPVVQHNTVAECVIGIDLSDLGAEDAEIFNNLFVGCTKGIYDGRSSKGSVAIKNNTIDGDGVAGTSYGIFLEQSEDEQHEIVNNIFSRCGYGIFSTCVDGLTVSYNGFYDMGYQYLRFVSFGIGNVTVSSNPFHGHDYSCERLGYFYLNQDSAGNSFKDAGDGTVSEAGYAKPYDWAIYTVSSGPIDQHGYDVDATISTDTTWEPDESRCDIGTVALGYHHPRIDYFIEGARVIVNGTSEDKATLTIKPGTVIAYEYSNDAQGDQENLVIGAYGELKSLGVPDTYGADSKDYSYIIWCDTGRAGQIPYLNYATPPDEPRMLYIDYDGGIKCFGDYEIAFNQFLGLTGYAALFTDITYADTGGIVRDSIFGVNYCYGAYFKQSYSSESCQNNLFYQNHGYDIVSYNSQFGLLIKNCTFESEGSSIFLSSSGTTSIRNCIYVKTTDENSEEFITTSFSAAPGAGDDKTWYLYDFINMFYTTYPFDPSWSDSFDILSNPYRRRFSINQSCAWIDSDNRGVVDFQVETGASQFEPIVENMWGYTTDILSANPTEDVNNSLDVGYHFPIANTGGYDADSDNDGLYGYQEYWRGTIGNLADTDGDGLTDGYDGIVPLEDYPQGIDKDGDGFIDGELGLGYDPTNADSDGEMDGATVKNCITTAAYQIGPIVNPTGCRMSGNRPMEYQILLTMPMTMDLQTWRNFSISPIRMKRIRTRMEWMTAGR